MEEKGGYCLLFLKALCRAQTEVSDPRSRVELAQNFSSNVGLLWGLDILSDERLVSECFRNGIGHIPLRRAHHMSNHLSHRCAVHTHVLTARARRSRFLPNVHQRVEGISATFGSGSNSLHTTTDQI